MAADSDDAVPLVSLLASKCPLERMVMNQKRPREKTSRCLQAKEFMKQFLERCLFSPMDASDPEKVMKNREALGRENCITAHNIGVQ